MRVWEVMQKPPKVLKPDDIYNCTELRLVYKSKKTPERLVAEINGS